jgi:hypothetical protein
MKKSGAIHQILTLPCAWVIVAGSATHSDAATGAPPDSGHLLVYRGAKFGYRLNLVLSIDGRDVASLIEGQSYNGYLPATQHVLVARVTPNKTGVRPRQQTVTVQAGHIYAYTAVLSEKNLVLVRKKWFAQSLILLLVRCRSTTKQRQRKR